MDEKEISESIRSSFPDLIQIIAKTGEIVYINENIHQIELGYDNGDLKGKRLYSFLEPETIQEDFRKIFEEESGMLEYQIKAKNGTKEWYQAKIQTFETQKKKDYALIYARNIQHYKDTLEAIKTNNDLYRLITKNVRDLVSVFDENNELLYINDNVEEISGFTKEEVLSKAPFDFIHPDDLKASLDFFKEIRDRGMASVEIRQRNKAGDYVWLNAKGRKDVSEEGLNRFIMVSRDVTQKKEAELRLRESEQKYKSLFKHSPFIILILDNKGMIVDVNPATEEILEYSPEDLIGKKYNELPIVEKKYIPELLNRLKTISQGKLSLLPPFDIKIRKKNGKQIWARVLSSLVKIEPTPFIQVIGLEVTEEKKMERLKNKEIEQLKELEDMRKNMIVHISHELLTPLTTILGSAELLIKFSQDKFKIEEWEMLHLIEKGGKRLQGLINTLMDATRIEFNRLKLERASCDLSLIVRNVIEEMDYLFKTKDLISELNLPDCLEINIDKKRIEQILINLVSNSIKNTPPNGKITVTLTKQKPYVELSVQDTGVGITASEKKVIFSRFGKVERSGEEFDFIDNRGIGLGLYFSKQIIELHGGTIKVESEGRNKGATFKIRLPFP